MRLRGVRLLDLGSPRGSKRTSPQRGPAVDIHIEGGLIAEITPASSWRGGWAMPGLWDHHVHMTEWARTSHRLDLSSCASPAQTLEMVRAAIRRGGPMVAAGSLVGTGLWHSRWAHPFGQPGAPSQADLDAATGDIPTVLISGDLHSAWFNSAAARLHGLPLESSASGLVSEEPWFAVMPDIAEDDPAISDSWVRESAARAAARGVVGIVDFDFSDNIAAWRRRAAAGFTQLRVRAAVWPEQLDEAIAAGHRSGDPLTPGGLVEMGALKIISDGSLNTQTAWCLDPYPDGSYGAPNLDPGELRRLMAKAHSAGLHSAIHAIGDRANASALAAFAATGARGSVEHAQLLHPGDVERLRELGVSASVQPAHLLDDRDTANHLWAGRTARAYPLAELHRGGVELRFGSDAPVAPLDPWLAVQAACTRTGDERPAWHGEQILERRAAVRACVGAPLLTVGGPADIAVLGVNPLEIPADELQEIPVLQTICAGRVTHEA